MATQVWIVALRGAGGVGVLGGKSSRAKGGEPNDTACIFASRGAAKRLVRIGRQEFDFLSTALRREPAEDVGYIQLRPDAIATFAKELGLPYVMPNPDPRKFFREEVVEDLPVEEFANSLLP